MKKSIIQLIFEIIFSYSYQAPWSRPQDIKEGQNKYNMDEYRSPAVDQQYNIPNFIVK